MTSELPRRVRSLPDGAACLVIDVFREGMRMGATEARPEVLQHSDELEAELRAGFEAPKDSEMRARLEAAYRGASPSPLISARFGGAEQMSIEHRYASRDAFALRLPTAEAAMEDWFGKTALDPPRVLDLSGSPRAPVRAFDEAPAEAASGAPAALQQRSKALWPWLALMVVGGVGGLLGAVVGCVARARGRVMEPAVRRSS